MRSNLKTNSSPWASLSSDGAQLEVEDFLTSRVLELSNALRGILIKPLLEEFEIGLPEWRLLAILSSFGRPMSFSEAVKRSGMDKAQVSRTMRKLSASHLARSKPVKRRHSYLDATLSVPMTLSVTAKGRSLYTRMLPKAQKLQAEMLGTLTKYERLAFFSVLDKLSKTVNARNGLDEE